MTTTILRSLAALSLFALAACGGPDIGAVVGPGVEVRTPEGTSSTAGPVALGNGGVLTASAPAVARVTCGGTLHDASTLEGRPGSGLADLHLDPGAEVKRREGAAFDLLAGSLRLHAGPLKARIVVFHGTTFLEVPTKNAKGVDVRLAADGDALTVDVTRGDVLVHSTGATQKELHYVTLGPGESATATPGSKPVKRDAAD